MKRLTNAEKAELHKKLEEAEKAKFKPYEDRIAELEEKLEQTEKDLADYQFNYLTIKELQKENAELKEQNVKLLESCEGATMMYKGLCKAKELIKNIIRVTWGEGWNYSLDWKVKAEQFLNNKTGD